MAHSFIKIEYEGDLYGQSEPVGLRIPYEDIDQVVSAHKYFMQKLDETGNTANDPDAQKSRDCLEDFWNQLWTIIPSLKQVTERSTAKAQEVFGTTELLEQILSYLDTRDKLQAMSVQRHWRDTVNGSIMLLRALGLEAYDDWGYYSPLSNRFQARGYGRTRRDSGIRCPGFCYDDSDPKFFRWDQDSHYSFWTINYEPHGLCEEPTQLQITLNMWTDPARLRFGSRVAAMRITNPLLVAVQATPACECRSAWATDSHIVSTASEQGFTLGELADYTLKFAASHTGCKIPWISYEFVVTLQEDDVVMLQRREAEKEADVLREVRRAEWLEGEAGRAEWAEWLERQAIEEEQERREYYGETPTVSSPRLTQRRGEGDLPKPFDLDNGSERDQDDAGDAQIGMNGQVSGIDQDDWEVVSAEVIPGCRSANNGESEETSGPCEQQ